MFIATREKQNQSSFRSEMFSLLISLLKELNDSITMRESINISALTGLGAISI